MKVLQSMSDEDLSQVFRFRVSRAGFGSIEWEGCTDVRHLNLDDIVNIEHQSISVYEGDVDRPPVGRGLNRAAVLTLYNIYPGNRTGSQDSYFKFEEKLKKICKKRGAEFRSYDIESGEWSFKVDNFEE
ncbi:nup98 [Symbiodinium microadriaticum]|nr:nup98 [Symbiodinium microadriaticum]